MRWWLALLMAGNIFAGDLQKFNNVRLVDNPSNDGDSFVVQAGDRKLHLRLYFVDCPESVATTDADAKRVREQARYYGITDAKKIFEFGHAATVFTAKLLARPFTVYTAFASAMGRSPGGRVYAFVITSDGQDLAYALVENGLARAYGTKHDGPGGKRPDELQKELQALEVAAMLEHRGGWVATEAKEIARLRAEQQADDRADKELIKFSAGKHAAPGSVDLNTATARELQSVSGIGPILATEIIAGRPYKSVDELLRISGVGQKLLERIRPALMVNSQ
ncbi:MAG: helix-hairpin-helix domain-containing protein [Verrucomicrobiota bacterium]